MSFEQIEDVNVVSIFLKNTVEKAYISPKFAIFLMSDTD